MIKITLNELEVEIEEGCSVAKIKEKFKHDADIVILNGFHADMDDILQDEDVLALIKRGEVPKPWELERLIVARHSPKIFDRLRNAKIAIGGLGGLGSHAAVTLARTGVGLIKLVDYDIVEPSNLNRQHYNIDQIGMPKTEALKENIMRAVNITEIQTQNIFVTEENIGKIFSGFDAVIEAFDKPETKTMFVEKMSELFPGTFVVAASGIAGIYSTELFQLKKIGKKCIIVGDFVHAAQKGRGLMAARVATAANIQANLVIRYLMGEE